MKRFNHWHVVKVQDKYAVQRFSWWGRKPCDEFASNRHLTYTWKSCDLRAFGLFDNLGSAKQTCDIKNRGLDFPKVDDESEIMEFL